MRGETRKRDREKGEKAFVFWVVVATTLFLFILVYLIKCNNVITYSNAEVSWFLKCIALAAQTSNIRDGKKSVHAQKECVIKAKRLASYCTVGVECMHVAQGKQPLLGIVIVIAYAV